MIGHFFYYFVYLRILTQGPFRTGELFDNDNDEETTATRIQTCSGLQALKPVNSSRSRFSLLIVALFLK